MQNGLLIRTCGKGMWLDNSFDNVFSSRLAKMFEKNQGEVVDHPACCQQLWSHVFCRHHRKFCNTMVFKGESTLSTHQHPPNEGKQHTTSFCPNFVVFDALRLSWRTKSNDQRQVFVCWITCTNHIRLYCQKTRISSLTSLCSTQL